MGEWKEYRFPDFAEINPPVKLNKGEQYSFVEMKDLSDGQKYCLPSIERKLTGGSRFNEGDTLFARITPCLENGKICQARGLKGSIGFGSTEFLVFRGKNGVSDNDFVFYLSRWNEVRAFAEMNFDGTSGRQRVPKDAFNNLFLDLPELPEQKSIASILSSLDDKIDLLHRQNKTLEALAETLFRQWFVPACRDVHGAGREEAEAGWESVSLYDAIELVGGGTPKTEVAEYWDGNIKWISARDITPNHKGFIAETEKKITELGLDNSSTKILSKYSTVISARGTVGKYCFLSEDMAFSQSNYGIKPRYKDCYFFTYLLTAHSVEELQAAAYGSVFDTITTNTFKEHKITVPTAAEIQSFEESIRPYFEKMLSNCTQIRSLTRLRDTLLPKLMSGEVRVEN
ncbi:MAG: restriction endonuclease subunit S [Nitrospirota bacterium]